MKNMVAVLSVIAILGFLAVSESNAQQGIGWKGGGGWGQKGSYGRMFNPSTMTTVSGEALEVLKITPAKGMSYGVHVMLKTEKQTVSVHLGPGWYIENQDVKIEPKDMIEVKGSQITYEGKPAIIASEIKKGGMTLKLRDDNGVPVWAGWRGGN